MVLTGLIIIAVVFMALMVPGMPGTRWKLAVPVVGGRAAPARARPSSQPLPQVRRSPATSILPSSIR